MLYISVSEGKWRLNLVKVFESWIKKVYLYIKGTKLFKHWG